MTVKRIITDKERENIKHLKKYKYRHIQDLSKEEKDDLLEMIAKKLGYL